MIELNLMFGVVAFVGAFFTAGGNHLGPPNSDIKGKIKSFTDNDTCISCNDIIFNFSKDYPGITIEIIHNNGVKLPKK
ncbi:deaminase domain-containing protein [Paenibacillus lautus]|uniref:deaminase domain-containing protein n=1 Tax=Paenibacillus lautus TaxID=1401 RepID=UPI003D2A1DE9